MGSAPHTYITPEGFESLLKELQHLRSVARPQMVDEVAVAAAHGDRSENAEYIYGKKKLRQIDGRMRHLSSRIEACKVVDPSERRTDRVFFGATVRLEDEEGREVTYRIVGPDDATNVNQISYQAPIGAALLGRRVGDEVKVKTPGGNRSLEVLEII